jgi:hypothetical protein
LPALRNEKAATMKLRKETGSREHARKRWRQLLGRGPSQASGADDDLLELLREQAMSTRADVSMRLPRVHDPASAEAIAAAEKSLDFALPSLFKRMLLEVGNGGFGPGHGLLGVAGGARDEQGNSLVDLYDGLSARNPEDPGWCWPERLVPIAPWGDSTYSCVDCSLLEGQMATFDANDYRPGAELARFIEPQDLSLERWLRAWVDGVDLWAGMFPLD